MRPPPRPPFDWPAFLRGLPFQPVPTWVVLGALGSPLCRALPALTRAACAGRPRESAAAAALVVYTLAVPAPAAALIYLLAGRRRIADPRHRRIGDVTLALVLLLSAVDGFVLIRRIGAQWTILRPGLQALRAACWP